MRTQPCAARQRFFATRDHRGRRAVIAASCHRAAELGWLRGLEPPTSGITIQDSNQLSYSHHLKRFGRPVPWAFRRHPGRGCPCSDRSEEHTSELQSLMRISYAVFCLKKKKNKNNKRLS